MGLSAAKQSSSDPTVWSRVLSIAKDDFGKSHTRTLFGRADKDDPDDLNSVRWDYGFCKRQEKELLKNRTLKSVGLFATKVLTYSFEGRNKEMVPVTERTVIVMAGESPSQALHSQGLYLSHEWDMMEPNIDRLLRNGYHYEEQEETVDETEDTTDSIDESIDESVDEATGEIKNIAQAVPEPNA